jgi:hypothetical protein
MHFYDGFSCMVKHFILYPDDKPKVQVRIDNEIKFTGKENPFLICRWVQPLQRVSGCTWGLNDVLTDVLLYCDRPIL